MRDCGLRGVGGGAPREWQNQERPPATSPSPFFPFFFQHLPDLSPTFCGLTTRPRGLHLLTSRCVPCYHSPAP